MLKFKNKSLFKAEEGCPPAGLGKGMVVYLSKERLDLYHLLFEVIEYLRIA